jgi:hypothetical protein
MDLQRAGMEARPYAYVRKTSPRQWRAGVEARPYAYVRKTSPRQWRAGVEADPTHFDVTPSRGDTKRQCGIFWAF